MTSGAKQCHTYIHISISLFFHNKLVYGSLTYTTWSLDPTLTSTYKNEGWSIRGSAVIPNPTDIWTCLLQLEKGEMERKWKLEDPWSSRGMALGLALGSPNENKVAMLFILSITFTCRPHILEQERLIMKIEQEGNYEWLQLHPHKSHIHSTRDFQC